MASLRDRMRDEIRGTIIDVTFEGQPQKTIPDVFREVLDGVICIICNRSFNDHSDAEFTVCVQKQGEQARASACEYCGRIINEHSYDELQACVKPGRQAP